MLGNSEPSSTVCLSFIPKMHNLNSEEAYESVLLGKEYD
jgi:hypothetical protein